VPAYVLLADDEPFVRAVVAGCLQRIGLRPLCAASGEEAVELCRRHRGEVAVALLDLNMPGLGGAAALAALRRLSPGLPVLLVTGAAELLGAEEAARLGASGVLAKPFRLADLAAAVRAWLPAP
jgi:two-component system cell cycle sensor histidine kinase/response regulator CckA